MAEPVLAEPVKLLVAVLMPREIADDAGRWCRLISALADEWGKLDYQGPDHAFDATDYYADEMGDDLVRRLIGLEELFPPERIGAAKHRCNELEAELKASTSGRAFNLDIGYLDHAKLVLASMKPAGQKIYLGDGVYADPIARYEAGRYQPFPWTFPDFRDGRYDAELGELRTMYLRQLNQWRANARI